MTDYGGSKEFWHGVRLMLPIAIGDLLEGAAFGALAGAVLGQVAPVAMSLRPSPAARSSRRSRS